MKWLGLIIWTWLWLGPLTAFHHMVRFGLLGWGVLDMEGADDGEGGGVVFRWTALVLLISFGAWLGGVLLARAVLRRGNAGREGR